MSNASQSSGWPELIATMSQRFGGLADQVLDNLRELLDAGRGMVNCAETALLVPNADGTHLRFLVSVNSKPGVAEIVTRLSVPCDRSIVGCVFQTGQLMAIANPDDFYQEVDQKTGLKTNVYLVTPVVEEDEILGVATFMNRPADQPQEPFNKQEIEDSVRVADLAVAGLRFYRRLLLQQKLFQAELSRVAQRFASPGLVQAQLPLLDADELNDQSPLARVIMRLEKMSRHDQDLAADLIGVLASHADSGY